jgi:hypothetical protein
VPRNNIVYALDIGVYHTGENEEILNRSTAAWCRLDGGIAELSEIISRASFGKSIPELAAHIANDLSANRHVSLGFEAPMWLPLEHEHKPQFRLFGPRFDEEEGAEWYKQSGAAATLKAISLGVMLRECLNSRMKGMSRTTDPNQRQSKPLNLFEAFVVGPYKLHDYRPPLMNRDHWDAFIACLAWGARIHKFRTPVLMRSRLFHEAGSRRGPCLSIWDIIFSENSGANARPVDCAVVALEPVNDGGTKKRQ